MNEDRDTALLSPAARKFVVHWGELGTRWGINRAVAQVHALLYVSQRPLDGAAIAETLGIARSNASGALKELRAWGIVRPVHLLGDRREHYEAISDVWQMLAVLSEARKRREVDPTLALLRECAAELKGSTEVGERHIKVRIGAMLELFETLSPLLDEVIALPAGALRSVAGFRGRVRSLFEAKG